MCAAGSRIFIHDKIYDKFLGLLTESINKLPIGDPFKPDTFQGPQISQTHYEVSGATHSYGVGL